MYVSITGNKGNQDVYIKQSYRKENGKTSSRIYKKLALRPTQFKVLGSEKFIYISTLDETDPEVYNSIYYKEYPLVTGDMDETVIITYSPKYKAYQQRIRASQIERAVKSMQSPEKARKGKRREDSIKAHFLICYISLLVYRLLEKKLEEEFTCSEILKTLREMNMTLLSKDSGYIPSYKRTKLTDALHTAFGFRTDYEFISKADMRAIIKETKQKK